MSNGILQTWRKARNIASVTLGGPYRLEHVIAVARYKARVDLGDGYIARVQKARSHVDAFAEEGRAVYGITTGLGENWNRAISPEDLRVVQRHHVLSHSCSVGEPLEEECVRAMMFVMLVHFGTGLTGIGLSPLNLLADMLNRDVIPQVPGHGSVGYICHEAHIAAALIGEGYCRFQGKLLPSTEALTQAGLSPIVLQSKEGLTLVSGTTSVTAFAALGFYDALTAALTADVCAAMSLEVLKGTLRAMDPRVHEARPHAHQVSTAKNIRSLLLGSGIAERYLDYRVQDALSLRCIPQMHGASKKILADGLVTLSTELNSSVDNPLIFGTEGDGAEVVMACNADGSYVGMASDCSAIALTALMKISERRIDRMVNLHVSELPPFLNRNPGLNNGLMIPQYAAAGLLGEMKLLSHPATIDNAVTCALQEDYTSMGGNAAIKFHRAARLARYILAIELLNAAQAQDFYTDLAPAPATRAVRDRIREEVPFIEEDQLMQPFMESIADMVSQLSIIDAAESTGSVLDI